MKQSDLCIKGYISNIQRYSIHDGPGIRTTVFFKGCPLRCGWCANPETQNMMPEMITDMKLGEKVMIGKEIFVKDVINTVQRDKVFYCDSNGGMTLSGGEVLMQPKFARALLDVAHDESIHTVIETSGYALPEVFDFVSDAADLILFDIKGIDEKKHIQNTGVSNKPILENLKRASEAKKNVIVRIPIIPRHNATVAELQATIDFVVSAGIKKVEMLPYHRLGESKYKNLDRKYEWKGISLLSSNEISALKASIKVPENIELVVM